MTVRSVVERLIEALNAHDIDAFVDCFELDYRSEQPTHPERAFGGREQVRENWSTLFEQIPEIRGEILSTAVDGKTVWAELRIHGDRKDGTKLDLRGVTINGIGDNRISWARLYLEEVEAQGAAITETVDRIAGRSVNQAPEPS